MDFSASSNMLEKLGEWGGNANLIFILVISTHIHTDHQRGVNQVLFRKVVCLSPAMFSFILAICGEAFLSFFCLCLRLLRPEM